MAFQVGRIMALTQILVHKQGLEQGFQRCFADGLSQSVVSSGAQARFIELYLGYQSQGFRIPNCICISIVFNFCWDGCNTQKKWKTKVVLKCSWENAILPGAFKNNGLCRNWEANRVYYGQLENREQEMCKWRIRKSSNKVNYYQWRGAPFKILLPSYLMPSG